MNDLVIILLIIGIVSLFGTVMNRKRMTIKSNNFVYRPKADFTNKIPPKGGSNMKEPNK